MAAALCERAEVHSSSISERLSSSGGQHSVDGADDTEEEEENRIEAPNDCAR